MTDRAERRRQARAARKDAQRSPLHTAPEGIPPLPGSSLKRATELFIQACIAGPDHPYAGMSLDDIRKAEHERRPVPNRAMARRYGIRSGYTRRLGQRLAMAADIKRADFIDDDPARKAAHNARRKAAGLRALRRASRRVAA